MSKKIIERIKYWSFLNFGILLTAAGIYFFKAPNGFATGGVSGLSIVLSSVISFLTQAEIMLAINATLLIIGVIVLGKECGALTFYCSIMLSLENWLFETLIPLEAPLSSSPLLDLVYAVLFTGIGSAIVFKCRASTGGTDIVALVLRKYTSMDVGKALLVSDFLIAASTFF